MKDIIAGIFIGMFIGVTLVSVLDKTYPKQRKVCPRDTTTIVHAVNDSLIYEATFYTTELDSVKRSLKEYAKPINEIYRKK